jgi:hypothetical protein
MINVPTVIFRQVDPRGEKVVARLGDGFVAPAATGGWSLVQRARNASMTEWVGHDPVTMDVPISFDGWHDERPVSRETSLLYSFMRRRVGTRFEPAAITCTGNIPLPFNTFHWVINSIGPVDEVRRQTDGHVVRANFVVSLIEYVPGDVIAHHKHSPAKAHQQKKGQSGAVNDTRVYVVKAGDTLPKIAARQLHKQSRWHEIAKMNGIRDPYHLKTGRHLKIPKS